MKQTMFCSVADDSWVWCSFVKKNANFYVQSCLI